MKDLIVTNSLSELISSELISSDSMSSRIPLETDILTQIEKSIINSTEPYSSISLASGTRVFLKRYTSSSISVATAEAQGLHALHNTHTLKTPRVWGIAQEKSALYLLMEYIDRGKETPQFWERFGTQLAEMHQKCESTLYGFSSSNFIGPTTQNNTHRESWASFFAEYRLLPQIQCAYTTQRITQKDLHLGEALCTHIQKYIPEPDHPSLLHGDLWNGNYIAAVDGTPVIIDPAVYYGHSEADIAMTELFGGFHPLFYKAYYHVSPLVSGYEDRRDIYNLYHLLNHLNIFGAQYYHSVQSILRRLI